MSCNNTENTVNTVKTAYIFGAASIGDVSALLPADGLVIAADGGLSSIRELGITPNIVMGDFDSLGYIPDGEYETELHPVEKDDTDMGLAVKKALSMGYTRLFLFGGMGGERPDHTLANLQTLISAAKNCATAFLTNGKTCFTALSDGEKITFPDNYCGNISVLSAEGCAEGVTISGLKYTVENATLNSDFPLGVSNSFIEDNTETHGKSQINAEISVKKGTLWICFQCEGKTEKEFPIITK